jgi:hypothetical protein
MEIQVKIRMDFDARDADRLLSAIWIENVSPGDNDSFDWTQATEAVGRRQNCPLIKNDPTTKRTVRSKLNFLEGHLPREFTRVGITSSNDTRPQSPIPQRTIDLTLESFRLESFQIQW